MKTILALTALVFLATGCNMKANGNVELDMERPQFTVEAE